MDSVKILLTNVYQVGLFRVCLHDSALVDNLRFFVVVAFLFVDDDGRISENSLVQSVFNRLEAVSHWNRDCLFVQGLSFLAEGFSHVGANRLIIKRRLFNRLAVRIDYRAVLVVSCFVWRIYNNSGS